MALCNIAGDNASGLYLEFFLVKPAGTEPHAFVGSRTDASVQVVDVVDTATGGAVARTTDVPVHASEERGWDDDEAPFPPQEGSVALRQR